MNAETTPEQDRRWSRLGEPRDGCKPRSRRAGAFLLFFFGIVLPIITVLFEVFSGSCEAEFFDPIPTLWHILLVAVVPATNLLAWRTLRRETPEGRRGLGVAQGMAIAISAYYALFFLPMTPYAVLGLAAIVYFGVGLFALLPLAPLLSLVATLRYRSLIQARSDGQNAPSGVWRGVLVGVLLLAALAMPAIVTHAGLGMAVSEEPDTSRAGIRLLRRFGNRDVLLRECYGMFRNRTFFSWGDFSSTARTLNADKARAIFYRVTGESFDTLPPPSLRVGFSRRWSGGDQFDFDAEQGGEKVAGRLRGLALVDSRLDGTVYSDAATAYLEWTLVFRNEDRWTQREARAQIQLPPGAVASRLTLWVNGEEREAAFGGRSRVREAYQKVVQVQRRDPVLVNTCGPDRLLVQCFPVEPNGGTMKTRIGITVPLAQLSPEGGALALPRILERNFGIAADQQHAIWIEGDRTLAATASGLIEEQTPQGRFAVRGSLGTDTLNNPATALRCTRDGTATTAWARDTTTNDGHYIRQRLLRATVPIPKRIVVVVDGSKGMWTHLAAVVDGLNNLGPDTEFALLFAGDVTRVLTKPAAATGAESSFALDDLSKQICEGGQDNTDALVQAWDWASQSPHGVVVWIHGPARYLLSEGEALRQRFERRPGGPVVYALQTEAGPHRLVEKLDGLSHLRSVPRRGSVFDDLVWLLQGWQEENTAWTLQRERVALGEAPTEGAESTTHLVRLWAYGRILELFAAGQPIQAQEATELGCRYHLVTPLTGAVVLETQQQYDEAGLRPVDPASVPTVPESETWAMIVIAIGMVGVAAVRRRRRAAKLASMVA